MLLEWEKENEGKKQVELVTKLLKDYNESRNLPRFDLQSTIEKMRIHIDHIRSTMNSNTETFISHLRDLDDQLKLRTHETKIKLEAFQKTTMEKIQILIASRREIQ